MWVIKCSGFTWFRQQKTGLLLVTGEGFTFHSTRNRSFWRSFPSQSLGLVWKKKQNLTQQKHTYSNQKKCTTTQNKQKTKARFSHLLRHPACKWRGPILVSALHKSVTYLHRHLPTYFSHGPTWGKPGCSHYHKLAPLCVANLINRCIQNKTTLQCAKNHAHWYRRCEDVKSNIMASCFWPTL